jgi:Transposase IS116/IS110/IS902 family
VSRFRPHPLHITALYQGLARSHSGQNQFSRGRIRESGLNPKEHSTGGKQRMGGISRAGHERLRQLLVTGATAVIRLATQAGDGVAIETTAAQAAQTRRGRPGQQDGADRLGDNEQRRGLSASTDRRRDIA